MKTRWCGRFLKRTRCTLCVAVHTLCTLVVSIPMGSLYLRPLSTPDGSFRAQFPKGALKTPKSLYYQLLLRYKSCCDILLLSFWLKLIDELLWHFPSFRIATLSFDLVVTTGLAKVALNKPSLRSVISSILIHFNFFYWIWNCLSLWLRQLSKLRLPLTSLHLKLRSFRHFEL